MRAASLKKPERPGETRKVETNLSLIHAQTAIRNHVLE
jgi:hypothetical protein